MNRVCKHTLVREMLVVAVVWPSEEGGEAESLLMI
jgi:hypothetical protein